MTRISEFGEALHVMYGPRIKARFMLQIGWGTMRNSVLPNVRPFAIRRVISDYFKQLI